MLIALAPHRILVAVKSLHAPRLVASGLGRPDASEHSRWQIRESDSSIHAERALPVPAATSILKSGNRARRIEGNNLFARSSPHDAL